MRTIFILIVIYIVYRMLKYFFRYLISPDQNQQARQNRKTNSKYSDVEEAKYIEIEAKPLDQSDKKPPEE